MDEFRQLEPSRVTQDHNQAIYHPPSRGQPTLVRSTSPRACAPASTTPRAISTTATAQVVKPSGPREVQVEVVQPSATEEAVRTLQVQMQSLVGERAQMVDWRGVVESQLAKQEQRLAATESKVAGFEQKWMTQQIDKLGEFLRSLQMQLTKCGEESAEKTLVLDSLQTQMARLQESSAERAKQESIATAARVDLDMSLKDLRLHVDGQLKLQVAHDSAINEIRLFTKEQKELALAVDSELRCLRDSMEKHSAEATIIDSQLKGLQAELVSACDLLNVAREEMQQRHGSTGVETVEVVHRSIAEHGILDRQEQQAEVLRSLQDELLSLQRQQRDASKTLADEVGVVKSKLNDNLATVSATVRSQTIEVQQAEFKDIRRNMETKLEQQEQIVKALRGHLSTNEEKMEQLLTQSRGQADGHAILDDVDALKKELLAQRNTQSSELEREADALHTHVHKAVTAEREARQLETAKCQAMLNSIQSELLKLSDDMKHSTRAMPTRHVLPEDLPPLECINSKTQLDKTLYIGPAKT